MFERAKNLPLTLIEVAAKLGDLTLDCWPADALEDARIRSEIWDKPQEGSR